MTNPQEPHQAAPEPSAEEPPEQAPPARPQPRQRRERSQANPAIDPRLVQLERRARRPSRAGDASLLVIAIGAFVFGLFLHGWVATSLISAVESDDDEPAAVDSTATPVATTAGGGAATTPTVAAEPTATPLPDRTSCDEIRGTQYRSVTEREFFLANCTSQVAEPTTPAEPDDAAEPTPAP